MARDVAAILASARQIIASGVNITYPSGSAARHVRAVVRDLALALEQAQPTQVDFVVLPKSHLFTPDEAAARKRWALEFIPKLAGVARGFGYGVFHGGTMVRDIDLIAMPWQSPTAKKPVYFVLDLCRSLNLQMGNHGTTLFGHQWFALWDQDHRDHQIDLKIVLPADGSELSGDE